MQVFKDRIEYGINSKEGIQSETLSLYDLNSGENIRVSAIESVPKFKRFRSLRTIQKYTFGMVENESCNILGISPTGTGKTVAFLLPTILKITKNMEINNHIVNPKIVIISPTRILRKQTLKECKLLIKELELDLIVKELDDTNMIISRDNILRDKQCDIIISLITDFTKVIQQEYNSWIALNKLEFLIVDEADIHFTELGDESSSLIYNLLGMCREKSKSRFMLYSASFPDDIIQNLKTILQKYEFKVIQIKNKDHIIEKTFIASENVYSDFLDILLDLPVCRVVVFVETDKNADELYNGYLKNLNAVCLNSKLNQIETQTILEKFSNNEYHILITKPSLFSRGVHVDDVRLVAILGLKSLFHTVESLYTRFQHACGRTGRSYKSGNVLVLTQTSIPDTDRVVNQILFYDNGEYLFSNDVVYKKRVEYLIDERIINVRKYFQFVYSELEKKYEEYQEIYLEFFRETIPEFKNLDSPFPFRNVEDFKSYVNLALRGLLHSTEEHLIEVSKINNTKIYVERLKELEKYTSIFQKVVLYILERKYINQNEIRIEYLEQYEELDEIKFLSDIYKMESILENKKEIGKSLAEKTREYIIKYGQLDFDKLNSIEFQKAREYFENMNNLKSNQSEMRIQEYL